MTAPTVQSPAFTCLRCGNCCRHAGEVRLAEGEAETIATSLGMDPLAFTSRYTRLREDRRGLALLDSPDGACIFLSSSLCLIQSAKPIQCRNFPISWKYVNLNTICPASAGAGQISWELLSSDTTHPCPSREGNKT